MIPDCALRPWRVGKVVRQQALRLPLVTLSLPLGSWVLRKANADSASREQANKLALQHLQHQQCLAENQLQHDSAMAQQRLDAEVLAREQADSVAQAANEAAGAVMAAQGEQATAALAALAATDAQAQVQQATALAAQAAMFLDYQV